MKWQNSSRITSIYPTAKFEMCAQPAIDNIRATNSETPFFLMPNGARKGEGGLRTQGVFKNNMRGKPLITIVTVIFNNASQLEETILSVINQTYGNIEYIIIDGGSTDETIDIIKKYEEKIDYWVSESDHGTYFAMNKGLSIAQGEWINFMNSGDSFYQHSTVEKVFAEERKEGVIYGDILYRFDGKSEAYIPARSLKHFWKGMQFFHQATFVRKELMQQYPFDTRYKFVSDFNSIYQMYLLGTAFHYKNIAICKFRAGGLSDNNPKSILECQKIIFAIHPELFMRVFYFFRLIECFLKYNLAVLVGKNSYAVIRKVKKWGTSKLKRDS